MTQKLLPNEFKKENYYYFSKWYCSELWNLIGQPYFDDEEEVLNLTVIDGSVFEFIACFNQNYYYIRYNSEDWSGNPSVTTQTLLYKQEGRIYNSSNKRGHLFSHWIDGNGKVYNCGDRVVSLLEGVGQYLDLYVQWKEISYTAYYRAKYNEQVIGTQYAGVKTFNEEFVLINCPFEIDGYHEKNKLVRQGISFTMKAKLTNGEIIEASGQCATPNNYHDIVKVLKLHFD